MKPSDTQQGSITLGLVFGLGMLGLSIAATTLIFSTTAITNNGNATQGIRTLVTADAAAREGLYRVVDELKTTGGTTTTFTTATIPLLNDTTLASVSAIGTWPVFTIYSTSTNPRITRRVVAELNMFPSGLAFDQAIYTNGELDINGGNNLKVFGDVYATGDIDLGGNPNMPGEIASHGTVSGDVAGDEVSNQPEIEPPTIDTSNYELTALIANNDAQAQNYIDTVDNVIVYINSPNEVSLNGGNFDGMIIVEGDLKIGGNITISEASTPPYDTPLAIYVKGDLTFAGNTTINGLVIVEGETSFASGNITINGSLLSLSSAADMSVNGSVTVNYNSNYATEWTELFEDGIITSAPPTIGNWHEE